MAGTKKPAAIYLPLWLQALDHEIGILIRCTHRRLLVGALYEARKQSLNPALQDLILFQPGEDLIYIAKKSVSIEP